MDHPFTSNLSISMPCIKLFSILEDAHLNCLIAYHFSVHVWHVNLICISQFIKSSDKSTPPPPNPRSQNPQLKHTQLKAQHTHLNATDATERNWTQLTHLLSALTNSHKVHPALSVSLFLLFFLTLHQHTQMFWFLCKLALIFLLISRSNFTLGII